MAVRFEPTAGISVDFLGAWQAKLSVRPKLKPASGQTSPTVQFATATGCVNEYAARGLDEYFAESIQVYVEMNDPACAWLPMAR